MKWRAMNLLEVIMAHLTIKAISLHALKAPIREVLAWIVVLAGMFAMMC
jgi:hypothetical protein